MLRDEIETLIEDAKRRAVIDVTRVLDSVLAGLVSNMQRVVPDTPLAEILNPVTARMLAMNRIRTVGDVRCRSVDALMALRGVSQATIVSLSNALEPHGFRIGDCV